MRSCVGQKVGGWRSTYLEPPQAQYQRPPTHVSHLVVDYHIDEFPIREVEVLFFDSQEDLWHAYTESTYEKSSKDSRENDYTDEEND